MSGNSASGSHSPGGKSPGVLILGCSAMQIPALRIAGEMGWRVYAADGNPRAEGRPLCRRFFHVDLKDIEGLIEAARSIEKAEGLDGVFTAGTDFSYAVARVAEALGLPGHSPQAALLATDKVAMRQCFRNAGVPSPDFAEAGPEDDAAALSAAVPGPWVVKPVDSMGARGVVRIDEPEGLPEALDTARSYSRSGRALLETYMEGPEFSLDALVEDGKLLPCGLADRHIACPPYFIEMGHTIPSSVSPEEALALWDVMRQGVRALGLTRGAAKGDVKLTSRGPMVGEIAARLSGGYMSGWTYPASSGIEPTRGALHLAVGWKAALPEASVSLVCAERALTGIDGTVRVLEGREKALALPGVREVFLRLGARQKVVFPRNNVEKAANVVVTGASAAEADRRALRALRALNLELDPADSSTGEYLDVSADFPPDCFQRGDAPGAEALKPEKAAGEPAGHFSAGSDFFGFLDTLWKRQPPRPSRGCPAKCPDIFSFPVRENSLLPRDFTGRTPADVLEILEREGRLRINPALEAETLLGMSPETVRIQADFWKALVRGGLPGARWYLERNL